MKYKRRSLQNNGHQRQGFGRDGRQLLGHNRSRSSANTTELIERNGGQQSPNQMTLAPEWAELNDDLPINTKRGQNQESEGFRGERPDVWNYAAVGLLGTFYVASLVSTYVSSNLLLYLLSGGAGIAIPMFGTQVSITEAVALMGAGILEGTSLSDAYLEHKNHLTGSRKWISRGGRFLAFIAQGLLYYMALGQLLFATADVSSLGVQGLEDSQQSSRTEASLVLTPPTPLHGAFVGTISFAWSFGTTYIGSTALLVAIERLRYKRKRHS
jgi:hypothetical protein